MTRRTAEELEIIAARFVILRDQNPSDPHLRAEIDAWRRQDPRNEGALILAEAGWTALDVMGEAQAMEPSVRYRKSTLFVGGFAAAMAATVALFLVPPSSDRFATMKGEMRRIPLADTSSAIVSSDSELVMRYTPSQRTVELAKGEAWFNVAKNRERPFVVQHGPFRVQAVGTAFSVADMGEEVRVLVTEGVVKIWSVEHPELTTRVSAGNGVQIEQSGRTTLIASSDEAVDRELAWRTGRLELAGEPLSYAVEQMNRHNRIAIVVSNASIADKTLYGGFRLDDPEGFARSAAAVLGAQIEIRQDRIELR